jgi:hypothetical protein
MFCAVRPILSPPPPSETVCVRVSHTGITFTRMLMALFRLSVHQSKQRPQSTHTQYSDSLHLTRVCLPAGLLFYRELELDAQVRNKPRGDGNNIICCSRNPPTSNWWPRRRRRLLILYTQQQLSGWLRVIAEHQVYIYISGRAGIVVVLNQHSLERGRERLAQLEKNKVLAPRNIQEVETRLYIRE